MTLLSIANQCTTGRRKTAADEERREEKTEQRESDAQKRAGEQAKQRERERERERERMQDVYLIFSATTKFVRCTHLNCDTLMFAAMFKVAMNDWPVWSYIF